MPSSIPLPLYHDRREWAKSHFKPKQILLILISVFLFIIVVAYTGLAYYASDIHSENRVPVSNNLAVARTGLLFPVNDSVGLNKYEVNQQEQTVPIEHQKRKSDPDQDYMSKFEGSVRREDSNKPVVHVIHQESIKMQDDPVNKERKLKVKAMIKHSWDGYMKYALGENELKPISKSGHSGVFGNTKLGATLVDSLDTLYIAGLYDEFNAGKEWVKNNFNVDEVNSFVSFFEFNIRFIGGFLSAYALSGDEVFKDKAIYVANKLMSAFNTPTGIPRSLVNFKTGNAMNWRWTPGRVCILSEVGTLQLEYQFLTFLTKNPIYLEKVLHVRSFLKERKLGDGTYPNLINPDNGHWGAKHLSLGAFGDSFYEYLLKAWLITNKKDVVARDMFFDAIDALEGKLFRYVGNKKFLLLPDFKNNWQGRKMEHLACFAGGMYALASIHATNGKAQHYLDIGKNITRTCHQSYASTASKLGPETFSIDNDGQASSSGGNMYLLRPETVESYFYLWRLTGDPIYREWGWEVVQALEKHSKVANGGYSGIKNVYSSTPPKDDVQQSFFIAETLKYLYLLFSDNNEMSLTKWVFNTEAHPLPVLSNFPISKSLNTTVILG